MVGRNYVEYDGRNIVQLRSLKRSLLDCQTVMQVSKLKFTEVLCSSSGFQHDNNAKKLFGTSLNLNVSLGSTPGNIEILGKQNGTSQGAEYGKCARAFFET